MDLTQEPTNFPRYAIASQVGLRSCLAFPIRVGDEVVAVMEFFSRRQILPSPALLRVLETVGVQLGRVVERHRAERALRRQNRTLARLAHEAAAQASAAEAASRAKSAFLAVTSHEIRTPLNAVLGLAHALDDRLESPAHKEMTQGILQSGEMLVRLLNAVLDFSRIEAGAVTARLRPYDLSELTARTVSMWTSRCRENDVGLSLDQSDLFVTGSRQGDPDKIEQTLVNLLSNALKFTPAGGHIAVTLSGPDADGHCRVDVVDGGPGVREADRDRVFVAYEQTDEGRRAGGAGLGLAICAGNMKALGGRIAADHDAQGRSRFWFSFPASDTAVAEPAAPEPTASGFVAGGTDDGIVRVLAAEDNAANRRVLQLLLAEENVELTCVEDGQQAVEALQTRTFDLVLMDANMPVMNGTDAVRAIRAMGAPFRDLPIQMLTANVFEEDVRRYVEAGADGVLSKPIEIPRLLAAVAHAAAEARQRRAA